mmetsp:Transcript_26891/g.62455  ORF Transcript_26891/g.62455 Transcript_26891/m.62455 type:complete len:102 (+) Transcript_26891:248-553(+)
MLANQSTLVHWWHSRHELENARATREENQTKPEISISTWKTGCQGSTHMWLAWVKMLLHTESSKMKWKTWRIIWLLTGNDEQGGSCDVCEIRINHMDIQTD